ncbi:MAG: hypothetical protein MSG64_17995 [Pyrinomonadaceae bacterium MAG19_C2-C3]|nr:hypothetical protein [Pyrinomonadaceae bacterium MAG19_C2-C3]
MLKILCIVVASILLMVVNARTNRFVESAMTNIQADSCSFPRLGHYRIHGKQPNGLESFREFMLKFRPGEDQLDVKHNQNGSLIIDGELYSKPSEDLPTANVEPYSELTVDGKFCTTNVVKFRFETAGLKCEADNSYKLIFTTETIDGIRYSFKGLFLKQPKLVDGMYINLIGKLTKHRDGRMVDEADLNFVNWSYE